MEGKGKIIAIVAVIIVIALAAVMLSMDGKDGGVDDSDEVMFLIQDNMGVYFWVEGSGDTVMDAYKDAMDAYDIEYTASQSKGVDVGIDTMFGLAMTQPEPNHWVYWVQKTYVDGAWEDTGSYMSELKSSENPYMALIYGDATDIVSPTDAKVWDRSMKGTVFTIESSSGLYFQVNGEGKTVMDAYKDAVEEYSIPYVASKYQGVDAGIDSMFGLAMTQPEPNHWVYWVQKTYVDGAWEDTMSFMNSLESKDHRYIALIYDDGERDPTYKP